MSIDLEDIRLDSETDPEVNQRLYYKYWTSDHVQTKLYVQDLSSIQNSTDPNEHLLSQEPQQKPKRDFSNCSLVEAAQYGLLARYVRIFEGLIVRCG